MYEGSAIDMTKQEIALLAELLGSRCGHRLAPRYQTTR